MYRRLPYPCKKTTGLIIQKALPAFSKRGTYWIWLILQTKICCNRNNLIDDQRENVLDGCVNELGKRRYI